MRDIMRAAEKRISNLEEQARNQFESSIVHNRVSVRVHEDDRLRHVVDVTERAYELEERDDLPKEMEPVPFRAAESLNERIDTLVDRVVARECADLFGDARADWFEDGHHDQEDVQSAFDEACAWLADHRDAAETVGIEIDDDVWDNSEDAEEVCVDV